MTTATIGKWGNASAVRLPQPFCEQLGLKVGDRITMLIGEGNSIVIRPANDQHTLQARLASWKGGRYQSEELDWGEPAGKELW